MRAKGRRDTRYKQLNRMFEEIRSQHIQLQQTFNDARKDVGWMDRRQVKDKLIRDIRRKELYKFSLEGMEFVEVENDKFY